MKSLKVSAVICRIQFLVHFQIEVISLNIWDLLRESNRSNKLQRLLKLFCKPPISCDAAQAGRKHPLLPNWAGAGTWNQAGTKSKQRKQELTIKTCSSRKKKTKKSYLQLHDHKIEFLNFHQAEAALFLFLWWTQRVICSSFHPWKFPSSALL